MRDETIGRHASGGARSGILLTLCIMLASFFFFGVSAGEAAEGEVKIQISPAHWDRLVKSFGKQFEQHSEYEINYRGLIDKGRPWPSITNRVRGNGDHVIFTSREDWKYQATEEDRETLRYVPFARQIVHQVREEVGSVEYGLVIQEENPSAAVEAFVEFAVGEKGQAVLAEPDPYYYVPLDREVVEFEPPEWFNSTAPGDDPKVNRMWHGIVQIREPQYYTTVLGELKMIWMTGFNQATGARLPTGKEAKTFENQAPLLEWAEDHNFILATTGMIGGSGQDYVDRVAKYGQHPNVMGTYFQNEDFLVYPSHHLYNQDRRLKEGEDEEEPEWYQTAKKQFPRWLRRKHGDIETLNRRWGTSYDSWDDIGLPELPMDWIEKVGDLKGKDLSPDRLTFALFDQPIAFHALAEFPKILDYQRCMREVWARKYKSISGTHGYKQNWTEDYTNYAKQLEPLTGPGKYFYTTKTYLNPFLFREVEEFTAAGYTYSPSNLPPHHKQIPIDTLQIAQDKPLWNSEHHLYNQGATKPGMISYDLMHGYLMGMFKSSIYNRQMTFMSGRPDRKGHWDTAERGPHYREEVKTRLQIRRNADVFHAFLEARADADIAVLVTEGNRGWNTSSDDNPDRPEMGGAVKGYAYVGALGKHWKYVINEDVSASHCTGTLIVDAPWLTPETAERINDLPEDRRVIAVGKLPTTDEYGESLPEEVVESLKERTDVIDGWDKLQDAIEPADGLFGPYTSVSNGSFWFWGPTAGRRNYSVPVPKLEIRRVRHDGKLYVAVTNHANKFAPGKDVVARLPWAAGSRVRELTDEDSKSWIYPEGEYLHFPPYSVRIFEIDETDFFRFNDLGAMEEAVGNHPANTENVNMEKGGGNEGKPNRFPRNSDDYTADEPFAWSIWKVEAPEGKLLNTVTARARFRGVNRLESVEEEGRGPFVRMQWSTDGEKWREFVPLEVSGGYNGGELEYDGGVSWQRGSNRPRMEGTIHDVGQKAVYLRVSSDGGARVQWQAWTVSGSYEPAE